MSVFEVVSEEPCITQFTTVFHVDCVCSLVRASALITTFSKEGKATLIIIKYLQHWTFFLWLPLKLRTANDAA